MFHLDLLADYIGFISSRGECQPGVRSYTYRKAGRPMSKYLPSVLIVAVVLAAGATRVSAQSPCDRACLRNMLDQYLTAVVKHDPAAAPLVIGFRQTENAINTRPGNGVWKTVTGLGKVQRRFLDAV